jgi:hypothetical protein
MIQLPIQKDIVKYILSDYIPYSEINAFNYIENVQFNKYRIKNVKLSEKEINITEEHIDHILHKVSISNGIYCISFRIH